MSVKPIFVSGIGRSGTSAVLSSLYTHKSIIDIKRIGEAPFISSYLEFLVQFENTSSAAEYNKKNYRLGDEERRELMAKFLLHNQCGIDPVSVVDEKGKYWITKTSLLQESFEKAVTLFGEVRCVYIMRNGIEVINSARKFAGFSDLSFSQQCKRWIQNLDGCKYLHQRRLCSTIKHDELVKNSENVFKKIYKDLELPYDEAPIKWIGNNLFNSSFDSTSKGVATSSAFDDRLVNAWSDWSEEEKEEFISLCDATMVEYNFKRPYVSNELTTKNTSLPNTDVKFVKPKKHITIVNAKHLSNDALDVSNGKMNKEIFNYICNVSEKHNYLYVNNAKVASTSLLRLLQTCEDRGAASVMSTPHDRAISPLVRMSTLSVKRQNQILFGDDVRRFTFVRNPYTRVLSAYLSKIAKPLSGYTYSADKPNSVPPKAQMISLYTGQEISESTDFSIEIGFATFVEILCQQETYDMDPHWKPQYELLMADKIDYSFVGRFEEMASEIPKLMSLINIANYEAPGYSKNRTDSAAQLEKYFTPDIVKLIADRFALDFEYYNYDQEIDLRFPEAV